MFQGKFYNVSRKFQGKLKNKISSKFKALQITKGRRAEVMEFIPYKSNEILENKYYQIPQELFINKKYKDKLNSDSKILYAFLLDRISLSQKNHWIDKEDKIYLIFTREEVAEKLNLSEKTVIKAFKQLTEVNLIQEKRQGLGKPNLIYVGKIEHEEIKLDIRDKEFISTNADNIKNVSV